MWPSLCSQQGSMPAHCDLKLNKTLQKMHGLWKQVAFCQHILILYCIFMQFSLFLHPSATQFTIIVTHSQQKKPCQHKQPWSWFTTLFFMLQYTLPYVIYPYLYVGIFFSGCRFLVFKCWLDSDMTGGASSGPCGFQLLLVHKHYEWHRSLPNCGRKINSTHTKMLECKSPSMFASVSSGRKIGLQMLTSILRRFFLFLLTTCLWTLPELKGLHSQSETANEVAVSKAPQRLSTNELRFEAGSLHFLKLNFLACEWRALLFCYCSL